MQGEQEFNLVNIAEGTVCVDQDESEGGEARLVFGNLTARHINKAGSEFYFTGDCTVQGVIYGYGDHGKLTVEGETTAKYIIQGEQEFDLRNIDEKTGCVDN